MPISQTVAILFTCLTLAACSSVYYSTMEKFGIEKRDILVDRVEEARDAQEETQEEFASALEEFSALVNFDGGELENTYQRLKGKFADSQAAAQDVSKHIDQIENVGNDLFREWQSELNQYSSATLKRQSEKSLRDTQRHYNTMLSKMRQAESKMYPILDLFQDQVLFLKHNLNAQLVGSLDSEVKQIASEVKNLIAEMEASIQEANQFIENMQSP